jgi:hypothetical protein
MKSEERLHSDCYVWFHNTYPSLRGLLCYNLNNSKNRIDGARNKAKGLQPGRADFTLYYNGTAHFIELKTEIGSQSNGQKEWEKLVRSHGFNYYICKTLNEFQYAIKQRILSEIHSQKYQDRDEGR